MLKLWKTSQQPLSHEDIFAARYERLLRWALRLTNNDRQEAEDLLHDAFIDFSLGQADLTAIENIDGYLRTVLRNIHLSAVRKASRHPTQPLLLVDYDSVKIGLRAVEPHLRLQLQDELRAICQYAYLRKESSKAGSVLILRFFHDYYPSEVARVMRSSSRAVSEWLRIARTETKTYLEAPIRLNFISRHPAPALMPQIDFARAGDDLSRELRRALFRLPHAGSCLARQQLQELYRAEQGAAIDCRTLSQIATCRRCLDAVNAFQGLPLLSERYLEESGRRDQPPTDGWGGGSAGGGDDARATGKGKSMLKFQRRAKEVFEHRPEELYISANGLFLVSQKISAGRAEQTLNVNIDEEIGFIEVLSEQSLRLLLLNVEPPPSGSGEQAKIVRLSDGRELTATLRFSASQPTLHVVYDDPVCYAGATPEREFVTEEPTKSLKPIPTPFTPRLSSSVSQRFKNWLRDTVFNFEVWLRPGIVTALLALIAVAALLFIRRPIAPVTARDLLRRSASAEDLLMAKADQVVHQTLSLEIAPASDQSSERTVTARRRIEIWQSAENKVTARRLYDEHDRLIAGAWTRSDGVTTLYQHGTKPQLQTRNPQFAIRNSEDMWLVSPSAKGFLASIAGDSSSVEERPDAYVVSYVRGAGTDQPGLVKATLTLRRADLHAIGLTLLVEEQRSEVRGQRSGVRGQRSEVRSQMSEETNRQLAIGNRQWIEYRLSETGFEQHPANTISPTVFEPEPELLSSAKPETRNSKLETSASGVQPAAPVVASAELEVELLHLLDQAGAFQGEQLSVTRTPTGGLMVQAVLDSAQRKAEILNALRPMLNNPVVYLQIETAAEAAERLSRARPANSQSSNSTVSNETVEVEKTALPVDAELRSYFRSRGVPADRVDEEIRRYATRVIDRSLQALMHARALKQLAGQFSPETLQSLDSEARAKWRAMLVEHARAFERETSGLRRELEPVFFPSAAGSEGNVELEVGSDSDFLLAATRLFEQASAHERTISRAFSNSAGGPVMTPIRSDQFRRSLRSAEMLAEKIARRP